MVQKMVPDASTMHREDDGNVHRNIKRNSWRRQFRSRSNEPECGLCRRFEKVLVRIFLEDTNMQMWAWHETVLLGDVAAARLIHFFSYLASLA